MDEMTMLDENIEALEENIEALEENTEVSLETPEENTEPEADTVDEQESVDLEELNSKKLLLEGEIAALEVELERRKAEADKAAREYTEFKELFPDADPEALTGEVLELTKEGVPLAAAYALYQKRAEKRCADAALQNAQNAGACFGSVGRSSENDYFTPDEVRAMTRNEVRANYQKIIQSMKSWS